MTADGLRWHRVATTAEARAGGPLTLQVDEVEIVVFATDGGFRAVDGACPHADGPLAQGLLDGELVECPWHGLAFDLRTGECRNGTSGPVRTHPTRERGGVLEVGLPGRGR